MTLDAALMRARGDSVEFPYLLANHAPMVLIALERLGASSDRIEEWFRTYRNANGLVSPPPRVAPISAENWERALGDRRRESDYRAFFGEQARQLGIDRVIRAYTPRLVQGVAGSALHPLMRLAYGVMKGDVEEVGTALGYWAATHLPLPEPGAFPPTLTIRSLFSWVWPKSRASGVTRPKPICCGTISGPSPLCPGFDPWSTGSRSAATRRAAWRRSRSRSLPRPWIFPRFTPSPACTGRD